MIARARRLVNPSLARSISAAVCSILLRYYGITTSCSSRLIRLSARILSQQTARLDQATFSGSDFRSNTECAVELATDAVANKGSAQLEIAWVERSARLPH